MHIEPDRLLDLPEFGQRHRLLRSLCLGMMVILTGVSLAIILVVRYALGGKPLAGNGGLFLGVPVITILGALTTLTAPLLAALLASYLRKTGIEKVALEPPALPEPGADLETEADRLWRVYASEKFAEYALAEAAVLICGLLFHLTADWLLMAFALAMVLYMASRFPTRGRIVHWFGEAVRALQEIRNSAPPRETWTP